MNADGTPIVPEGATPPTPAVNGTGGGTTLPTEDGIGVSKKRKVRGGHRAHLTKMLTEVTTQLTGYTEQREAKVLTLKSCLERKADVLSKLDADILEEMDDGGQMGMEIDQAEALQSQITEAIIKIDKAIKTAAKPESKPDVKPALSGEKRQTMKLPKYQVEDFHGDPKKWRSFKESFDVAVTNNPELSDVQMFHYLRGYLKGEARLAIEGLPVTADNFSEAVQLLEQRWEGARGKQRSALRPFLTLALRAPTLFDFGAPRSNMQFCPWRSALRLFLESLQAPTPFLPPALRAPGPPLATPQHILCLPFVTI